MKTVFALLFLVFWSSVASAGTLGVRGSGPLTPADTTKLADAAKSWPFDMHVLFESAPSRDTLEDDAHAWVDSPKALVVAIDVQHHYVVARFGTGTAVKPADYDSISKAGNAHFRSGEWEQGLEVVGTRALASTTTTTSIAQSNEPVMLRQGMSGGEIAFLCILGGFIALLGVWVWRKQRRERERFETALDENRLETQERRSRNIEEMTWGDHVKQNTAPRVRAQMRVSNTASGGGGGGGGAGSVVYATSPVVNTSSTNRDGFVDGLLVGELLNSGGRSRDVVIEREVERTPTHSRSSDDSGGSSSSWDSDSQSSSGDSSSSYDSGGSSSSWDSGGGGFDSGGGGFDGGGGGGDF